MTTEPDVNLSVNADAPLDTLPAPAAPDSSAETAAPGVTLHPGFVCGFLGVFIFVVGMAAGYLLGEQMTLSLMRNVAETAAEQAAETAAAQASADLANQLLAVLRDGSGGQAVPSVAVQPANPSPSEPEEITRFNITADDDPFKGPEDAPIVIIEFSDYQCPYCAQFYSNTLNPLLARYPDQIKFVFRDFPLDSIHPQATQAAVAANCAGQQGLYWEMHDLIFTNQQLLPGGMTPFAEELGLDMATFETCMNDQDQVAEVQGDLVTAAEIGVRGTPTFFINGRPLVGAQPLSVFIDVIEEELALLNSQ